MGIKELFWALFFTSLFAAIGIALIVSLTGCTLYGF